MATDRPGRKTRGVTKRRLGSMGAVDAQGSRCWLRVQRFVLS